MRGLYELNASGGLRATLDYLHTAFSNAVYGTTAAAHIQIGEHAQRVAENWDTMSSLGRAVHGVGALSVSVATSTIAIRLGGGAAHGLEDTLHVLPPAQGPTLMAMHAAAPIEMHDNGISLPTDTAKAPEAVNLGTYNRETGDGTLWNWGVKLADELGYGNLDENQERAMAAEMLQSNNKSWGDARQLDSGYDVQFPTQNEAVRVLENAGATKTHDADRLLSETPQPPEGGANPQPNPAEGQALPSLNNCAPPNPPGWYPLQTSFWNTDNNTYPFKSYWDCRFTAPDISNSLLIVAAVAGGAIGQAASGNSQGGRRTLYRTDNRTTTPQRITTSPPHIASHPVTDPTATTRAKPERRHTVLKAATSVAAVAAGKALLRKALDKTVRRKRLKNKKNT